MIIIFTDFFCQQTVNDLIESSNGVLYTFPFVPHKCEELIFIMVRSDPDLLKLFLCFT